MRDESLLGHTYLPPSLRHPSPLTHLLFTCPGEIIGGIEHSTVKCVDSSGTQYRGRVKAGVMHGQGTYIYPNGEAAEINKAKRSGYSSRGVWYINIYGIRK